METRSIKVIALFDILGTQERMQILKLDGVLDQYIQLMDKEKNIFLGPALIDAYLAESAGQWLGVSCGNSFSAEQYRGPFDPRIIFPYSKHQNPDEKYKLDGLVLDWPRLWRTTGRPDVREKLRLMDTEPEFHKYYSNAIAFVEEPADKHNWWEWQNSIGIG